MSITYREKHCTECKFTDKCLREREDIASCFKDKKKHIQLITTSERYKYLAQNLGKRANKSYRDF